MEHIIVGSPRWGKEEAMRQRAAYLNDPEIKRIFRHINAIRGAYGRWVITYTTTDNGCNGSMVFVIEDQEALQWIRDLEIMEEAHVKRCYSMLSYPCCS